MIGRMWDFDQPFFADKLIPESDAWSRFDDWRVRHTELGVLFIAKSARLSSLGTVSSVRNGRLEIRGETAGAGFNLKDARFSYGPLQVFPRWPMGPMVEVMAISAYMAQGEWLVLAEGVKPESLTPMLLGE
jgi:hypothetical protein